MQNSSMAAASDKTAAKTAGDEKASEKISEKIAEKRRALGRGLESLLPGPRAVTPASPSVDRAPATRLSPVFPTEADASARGGVPVEAPVVPSSAVELRAAAAPAPDGEEVLRLKINLIDENPHQTRRVFNETALRELAESIKMQGVVQPILVRQREDRYVLILGERRLRASSLAGFDSIPAVVRRVSDQRAAEMTLVENLQRQDLNCVEQAEAFANLSKNFKLTQEQIGAQVGVSRQTVANYMRILTLADPIILALQKGKLTYSHARVLLMVSDDMVRWKLAQRALDENLSVAQLEDLVQGLFVPHGFEKEKKPGSARWVDPNVKAAQRSLEEVLGMRVRIRDKQGRGKILIEYGTIEDFERVVRMLKGK